MSGAGKLAPLSADEERRASEMKMPAEVGSRPIVPVPPDAPEMKYRHPAHGEPSQVWPYLDAEGRRLMYAVRFDFVGEDGNPAKDVLPVAYCNLPGGRRGWRAKALPVPRPLYGLDRLEARPEAPVLVCEGEPAADAAQKLFPDYVAITSPGGSGAADKADWAPLGGRRVVLWRDADAPGLKYAQDVARLALAAGATSVSIVPVQDSFPEGWDLADAPPEGWDEARLRGLLESAEPVTLAAEPETVETTDRAAHPPTDPLAALMALEKGASLEALDVALRSLRAKLNGADAIRRSIIREDARRQIERLGVGSPARMIDAAMDEGPGDEGGHVGQGRPVVFADPELWPEPVDGATLLDKIADLYEKYVVLPPGGATAAALWTEHAYALEAAGTCPLLVFTSPEKRCGKSRALEVTAALAPRPVSVASITPSTLFRTVEKYCPTLLVDEADTFLHDNPELRGILNSGHTKAMAYVIRGVGDEHEPRIFSTWSPKAIGMIGRPPSTIEDRSIVITMRRRTKEEPVASLRADHLAAEAKPLRRMAARWAADHMAELRESNPSVPDHLNDRAQDNWRHPLAIADLAGGKWPERARHATHALSGTEEEDTPGIMLLSDIRALFEERGTEHLPSAAIAEGLVKLEDRPWAEWGKRAKPITQNQIARLLRRYRITSKTIRIGEVTAKGYEKGAFMDAWARYPRSEPSQPSQPNRDAENGPFSNRNTNPHVTGEKTGKTPRPDCIVTAVTVQKGGSRGKVVSGDDSDPEPGDLEDMPGTPDGVEGLL